MNDAELVYDPFSYELDEDPYPVYRRMRDEAPAYYNPQLDFFALTRFQDNFDALCDHATYSSTYGTSLEFMDSPKPDTGLMIYMDPPRHNQFRALVSKTFTPRQIDGLADEIRRIAVGYLEPLVGRSRFDVIKDFTARLPMDVISAMLGIAESDRQFVQDGSNSILHREPGNPKPTKKAVEASLRVMEYFQEQIDDRRKRPRDDMMTRLTQVEIEEDGVTARLSDSDIQSFILLLATAGNETVTKLLGSLFLELWRNPDERQRLLGDASMIPKAVEEILRFDPPSQYQGRVTTREVELHGVRIPEGARVLLVNGASGRDERKFADPDRFDMTRPPKDTLTFGRGERSCPGMHLARKSIGVALDALAARLPDLRLLGDPIDSAPSGATVRGPDRLPVALR